MKRFLSVALFLNLTVLSSYAVTFSRFSASLGFPQTNISGIVQDSAGDIWISSADGGVFRYDGYQIERIGSDEKIRGLFSDSSGRLFAGTFSKIYRLLPGEGLSLFSESAGFNAAKETEAGDVFFMTSRNISVLRAGRDTLQYVYGYSGMSSMLSLEYAGGKIYFGDVDGSLFELDPVSLEVKIKASFTSRIACLIKQDDDLLWVSELGKGVFLYRISTGQREKSFSKKDGLVMDDVQSMLFENDSTLWLGTYDGLSILDVKNSSITSASYYVRHDDSSLPHNSVKVLFKDVQGGMWVGTFFGGVCYYHKTRNRFKALREGSSPEHLNDNVVSCIFEAPDGTLWIGTNTGGINVYDKKTKTFSYYRCSSGGKGPSSESNDVKAFYCLPDGRHMLVGLFRGGLNILDCKTGKMRRLDSPQDVVSIVPGGDEDHLILSSYDNTYDYCISTGGYQKMAADYPKVGRFSKSDIIKDANVASVLQESEDVTWYATDNGLYKFVRSDSVLVRYSSADGLACDYYNPGSAFIDKDGVMYFGGVGGVTYFDPKNFETEEPCPKPILRSVTINGEKYTDWSSMMRLKSSQNYISFEFSVPDYISVRHNTFQYKLEGVDKGWNMAENIHSVLYPNLPAGSYCFRLKVSRGNSEWVESDDQLKFKIFRPWYSSVAGVTLEIVLLLLSALYIFRSIARRREMENALAMKKMEEKFQREITKLKALKLVNTELRIDQKAKQPVIEDLTRQDELFITKAMSIVESNMSNEDFSAEMLAQKLGISRVSLYNKIKEATGKSALDFIHKIRFSEACRLLEENELTISEIGYRIGIKNPSYFSASFKKVVGCTPREYADKQNLK